MKYLTITLLGALLTFLPANSFAESDSASSIVVPDDNSDVRSDKINDRRVNNGRKITHKKVRNKHRTIHNKVKNKHKIKHKKVHKIRKNIRNDRKERRGGRNH